MLDLPSCLEPGDLVVANETRVLPARLLTRLARTGRAVEVLLSHPQGAEWVAMLGPARRLREGDLLELTETRGALRLVAPEGGGRWRLTALDGSIEGLMERAGHIPLPHYLERDDTPADREWYQTVFAREAGAIAAPTAGLHFTPRLLAALVDRGIECTRVLLHVGPGTFLPVRASSEDRHQVLAERYAVSAEAARAIAASRARGGRVVAIGTTTVRALESAAARGDGAIAECAGWTDLTIVPGHRFRAVDALLTNFHLPRSSLLLLVSAFAERERVLRAYRHALDTGFRFYSYGDAMLIV
ncbi:MAG: tRNA preQ1(34) S-adenosylmethionine ribosyltransferase-isomerase QueA [Candidatus Eisenbacteria bacterium]